MAQVRPDILDIIDTDAYAMEMAKIQDVTRRIIRDQDTVAAIRKERADQQQMQQLAQTAQPAAEAVKSLAQARQLGGMGGSPQLAEATGAPS